MHGQFTADEALQRLIEGNRRFVRGEIHFPWTREDIFARLAKEQRPYAMILGCADSRVPPELIFGAGLGDLFVVRVAGNVLSPEVAGSLQYAGVHLHTPLLVVLGHEGCGAVKAALKTKWQGPIGKVPDPDAGEWPPARIVRDRSGLGPGGANGPGRRG